MKQYDGLSAVLPMQVDQLNRKLRGKQKLIPEHIDDIGNLVFFDQYNETVMPADHIVGAGHNDLRVVQKRDNDTMFWPIDFLKSFPVGAGTGSDANFNDTSSVIR